MKSLQVIISEKQIVKELPSRLLDKKGNPVMLSIVRLSNSNFGVGATCVVPSSSVTKDGDDLVVKLNPERTFEIRVGNESMGLLTGKDLSEQLGKVSKRSLQDRLEAADKKVAHDASERGLEKQEGLEQKQPSVEL